MKAGTKFMLGAAIIAGATALLIYTGISQTGVYFLSPSELLAKVEADASFHEVGLKVGAKVVPGSIRRDDASRRIEFKVADAGGAFPVVYDGLVPDTFTDENDIEVIMSGKLDRNGVFQATEVLAKCGSRYESEYSKLAQAS